MKRFNKILCYAEPVEQTGAALASSIELAKASLAQLTLVSIVNEIPRSSNSLQQSFIDIRHAELLDQLLDFNTTVLFTKHDYSLHTNNIMIR